MSDRQPIFPTSSTSPTRPSLHPLSRLLLVTAFVVLAVQLFMRATASATSWRGGGFGMYASPHPGSYRVVVAELHHADGAERIRLIPQDSTVRSTARELHGDGADRFETLRRRASRARVLPTAGRASALAEAIEPLVDAGLFGVRPPAVIDSIVVSFHELRPRLGENAFTARELSRGAHGRR